MRIEDILSHLAEMDVDLANDLLIQQQCESSLYDFIKYHWEFVNPGITFVDGWCIEAICDHLEAVSRGEIKKLCMNVSPGLMKSLSLNVFMPAWEWGPQGLASTRYISTSYSDSLTQRDNDRLIQVLMSPLYRRLWGAKVTPSSTWGKKMVQNEQRGWKLATSVGGTSTGQRGTRILIDDPNNVKDSESDTVRDETNRWFREVMPNRLEDQQTGSIIVIQQRTHDEDVSGMILKEELDYEFLVIPMEYEPSRHCFTSIGWQDPRGTVDGDPYSEALPHQEMYEQAGILAFPERFPPEVCAELKKTLGPYGWAGQYMQSPVPRGGAIFKEEWWRIWPPEDINVVSNYGTHFPPFEYVVGSVDTAYTEKEENDPSAMTVWGIFRNMGKRSIPRLVNGITGTLQMEDEHEYKIMLIYGWEKWLELRGPPEERPVGLTEREWMSPQWFDTRSKNWGLVEWVAHTAKKYRIDHLLIESKANGYPAARELETQLKNREFGIELVDPHGQGDKIARAHAVVHLFSNGRVYIPHVYSPESERWDYPSWARMVLDRMSIFPRGKLKDVVDTCLLPDTGILTARGVIPIKKITVGDVVMTHLGRWRPVTAVGNRKSDHICMMKLKGCKEIGITEDHPVWSCRVRFLPPENRKTASDTKFRPISELRERTRRVAEKKCNGGVYTTYTCDMKRHDAVLFPMASHSIGTLDLLPFMERMTIFDDKKIITERNYSQRKLSYNDVLEIKKIGKSKKVVEIANEYGISATIISNILNGKRDNVAHEWAPRFLDLNYKTGWCIGLFLAEGSVTNNKVAWACDIDALEKIKVWIYENLERSPDISYGSGAHRIVLSHTMMSWFFKQFGYLAENKFIPAWVFESPKEFCEGIVAGYSHGDGYIYKNTTSLTSSSFSLIFGMKILLAKIGISSMDGVGKPAGPRKVMGKISECLESYRLDFTRGNRTSAIVTDGAIGYHIDKLEKIFGDFEVYNLSVADDESYVTIGGTVHNCTQGLKHLRDIGLALRSEESAEAFEDENSFRKPSRRLYDV